jgi:WASH complex subunit strumpellin
MGLIFNLIEVWEPYKAARMALSNTAQAANVKECSVKHSNQLDQLITQLRQLLKEGVLTEEFLLDNMQKLINLIRQSNVTLRWMLLHTNTLTAGAESVKKCRQIRDQVLNDTKYQPVTVFELLLDCAELELNVRETFRTLLTEKRANWLRCKNECMERLTELADVFSGAKPLTRVDKNESLQLWLREIAQQVEALNYEEGTASGRKMVQLISALEEVQGRLSTLTSVSSSHNKLSPLLDCRISSTRFPITSQAVFDRNPSTVAPYDSYRKHSRGLSHYTPNSLGSELCLANN